MVDKPSGCAACGTKTSTEKRLFDSKPGIAKQLSYIFKKYTDIDILQGFLCLKCHRKLLSIHGSVCKFKELCTETRQSSMSISCKTDSPSISHASIRILSKEFETQSCSKQDSVKATTARDSVTVSEHSYSKLNVPVKNKKQKTSGPKGVTSGNVPHVSEHDHSYYVGSITDKSCFGIQSSVERYFKNKSNLSATQYLSSSEKIQLNQFINTGDAELVVEEIFTNNKLCDEITKYLQKDLKKRADNMNNSKKGFVSILMKKNLNDLECFQWNSLVDELQEQFPLLSQMIISVVMGNNENITELSSLVPRLGLIYGMMMQARNPSLSLTQRTVSMLLMDNICDQKVYDRLQKIGVSLSYQKSLYVLELMGGSFNALAIDAVKRNKTVRLIGDNVNFKTMIKEQQISDAGRTSHMHHAFASAFLINNFKFLEDVNSIGPQKDWHDVQPAYFMVTHEEHKDMKSVYVQMVSKVVCRFIPALSFVGEVVPQLNKGAHSKNLSEKTTIVPLETLSLNEQKYDDVVKILEYYENVMHDVHRQADVHLKDNDCFHIGGDQLTRERFSGAKKLRAGENSIKDRFGHLHPITFEFFYLLMNFLKVFNHFLYDKNSTQEVGTMMCELNRLRRTNFDPDVSSAYDADRDFVVSFVDAHIVELVMEYFGMDDLNSNPTKQVPPEFNTDEERQKWVYSTIGNLLDENLFKRQNTNCSKLPEEYVSQEEVIEEASIITCRLANGSTVEIQVNNTENQPCKEDTDGVLNYATLVLNLGLVYKELLDVCKMPDRLRIIRIMKQCLLIFKAKSNLNKYALEILRFLMQQTVLLNEKSATSTLYSMFVNTHGRIDSHIPSDLQMEYLVKLTKKHIKHMYSNKTCQNISKKTRALSSIETICDNFDTMSGVKIRCKKHAHSSYHDDELMMIDDLRSVRPFQKCNGRSHPTFAKVKMSVNEYLDVTHFHNWILRRVGLDGTDLGI